MQQLIVDDHQVTFQNTVNKMLREGWKVVPQTLVVGVTATDSGASNFHAPSVRERWAVVLEK